MTSLTTNGEGNTPLSPDELADLIPSLAAKEELNEWERENILHAREWAVGNRIGADEMVSEEYVRKLHGKMFDQTWKWAGRYRQTEKNLGVPFREIRFHHSLVFIHAFPNGNGRHARLVADVLAIKLGRPAFTWGSTDLVKRVKHVSGI